MLQVVPETVWPPRLSSALLFPPWAMFFLSPMCIVLYRFEPFHQTTDFSIARCVSSLGLDCRPPSRVLPLFPLAPDLRISAVFFPFFVCLPRDKPASYRRMQFIVDLIGFRNASYRGVGLGCEAPYLRLISHHVRMDFVPS